MGERGRTRRVAARCAVAVAVAVLGVVGVSGCSALRVATPNAATAAADAPTGQSGNTADAVAMLAQLPVRPLASKAGYSRSQFGRAWDDNVNVQWGHNGCDQRSDEMRSALKDVVLKPGSKCIVYSGVLDPDPYTGKVIHYIRRGREAMAIQIDHGVALANSWQTGAQLWTAEKRLEFANDPRNLVPVDGPTNQSKGDSAASEWLPPNVGYRCRYVSDQISVKHLYGLWVTPAEHDAMLRVLRTNC